MVVSGDGMTNYPYILFNQSPDDLRRIGARGGRAYGRNRRGLCTQGPRSLEAVERPVPHLETTAEAIASLDAQFSWLRGAGEPTSVSSPRRLPFSCSAGR
jgi:hypothetical protein